MFLLSWGVILFTAMALSEYAAKDNTGGLVTALLEFGQMNWGHSLVMGLAFASLVAAMLSTADTFLIATGQTISMDIQDEKFFARAEIVGDDGPNTLGGRQMPVEDTKVVNRSRRFMMISAVVGVLFCVGLSWVGFSVAQLVFARRWLLFQLLLSGFSHLRNGIYRGWQRARWLRLFQALLADGGTVCSQSWAKSTGVRSRRYRKT